MFGITRVRALALICGMIAVSSAVARADDDNERGMHETRNPGFTYRISNGSTPGSLVVTLKNDTGIAQRVFRDDPASQDEFVVLDEHHRRARRAASPPLGVLSASSRGTTLQPGDAVSATVDLTKQFVLTHGERYTVRARGYVGYDAGNGATKTFTYIDSNQVRLAY